MAEYAELHIHSAYSLRDSAVRITDLVRQARKLGHKAVAITDHGQAHGVIEWMDACRKEGVKGIVGCEIYIGDGNMRSPYHFVIWVKNEKGWKNYIKLLSIGNRNFYYRPQIPIQELAKYSEGLAASSACLASEISRLILDGRMEDARKAALRYQDIFGKGNFFLELQDHGIDKQKIVNRALVEISRQTGIPLIVANDVHYTCKEDYEVHRALIALQWKKTIKELEPDEGDDVAYTREHYLKSPEEMHHLFRHYPEALKNTLVVADMCNFDIQDDELHFPVFPVPEGHSINSWFKQKIKEGIRWRFPNGPTKEEKERILKEYEIIHKLGYEAYFLIVQDFIQWAIKNGIPVGPGRGSAAGSLIAYVLGITDVYPLPDLLFERFLNPERVSPPDIDVDFEYHGRAKVIEYVRQKYGDDKVNQIITFGTFGARGVVRDIARVLDYPVSLGAQIAESIPEDPDITLDDALQIGTLKDLYESDERVRQVVDLGKRLEGLPRHHSIHAAGVLITDKPMEEYSPVFRSRDNVYVSMFPMDQIQRLGLLKVDFLGLRNLSVIHETILSILKDQKEREKLFKMCGIDEASLPENEKEWTYYIMQRIPMDDPATFELIQSGRCDGIFQLEGSEGIKELARRLKPKTWDEVSDLSALYRPGPLGSGQVDEYIERKHGKKEITYLHPSVKPILEPTYGVLVYQEQIMQIAMVLAGYTPAQADDLRSAIAKKKESLIEKHKKMFVEGCEKKGLITREQAEKFYEQIEHFGRYAFNKSHSKAYAKISIYTAFLKAHFTVKYMTTVMSSVINNHEKTAKYLQDVKSFGIDVLPVDINRSDVYHTSENGSIRMGFMVAKGVGEEPAKTIVKVRGNVPFKSFYDFCLRLVEYLEQNKDAANVPSSAVQALIRAGAFDTFGNRGVLTAAYPEFLKTAQKAVARKHDPQISLFDFGDVEPELPDGPIWDREQALQEEYQTLGFFLTGHPLEAYEWLQDEIVASPRLEELEEDRFVRVGGIIRRIHLYRDRNDRTMAFIDLQDYYGEISVIVFASVYEKYRLNIQEGEVVVVEGRISWRVRGEERAVQVRAESLKPAREYQVAYANEKG